MDVKMTRIPSINGAWHRRYGEVGTLFFVPFSDQRLPGVSVYFWFSPTLYCNPEPHYTIDRLPALPPAQPMDGGEPVARRWRICDWQTLHRLDLRRWPRSGVHAQIARSAPGEKRQSNVLRNRETCGPISGNRSPRLGRRTSGRQSHLVPLSPILFSHARSFAGGDRALHPEHSPQLWFPSALVPLAGRPAPPAAGSIS